MVPKRSLWGRRMPVTKSHWSLSPGMCHLLCATLANKVLKLKKNLPKRPTPEPRILELISDKLYWYDSLADAGSAFLTDMKTPSRCQSGIMTCWNDVSQSLWCGGQTWFLTSPTHPTHKDASCLMTGLGKTQTFSRAHYCCGHFSQNPLHSKDDNYKFLLNI